MFFLESAAALLHMLRVEQPVTKGAAEGTRVFCRGLEVLFMMANSLAINHVSPDSTTESKP